MAVNRWISRTGCGGKIDIALFCYCKRKEIENHFIPNRKLKSAIHLYEKFYFNGIPLESEFYER
jgi:hypothetical protein